MARRITVLGSHWRKGWPVCTEFVETGPTSYQIFYYGANRPLESGYRVVARALDWREVAQHGRRFYAMKADAERTPRPEIGGVTRWQAELIYASMLAPSYNGYRELARFLMQLPDADIAKIHSRNRTLLSRKLLRELQLVREALGARMHRIETLDAVRQIPGTKGLGAWRRAAMAETHWTRLRASKTLAQLMDSGSLAVSGEDLTGMIDCGMPLGLKERTQLFRAFLRCEPKPQAAPPLGSPSVAGFLMRLLSGYASAVIAALPAEDRDLLREFLVPFLEKMKHHVDFFFRRAYSSVEMTIGRGYHAAHVRLVRPLYLAATDAGLDLSESLAVPDSLAYLWGEPAQLSDTNNLEAAKPIANAKNTNPI